VFRVGAIAADVHGAAQAPDMSLGRRLDQRAERNGAVRPAMAVDRVDDISERGPARSYPSKHLCGGLVVVRGCDIAFERHAITGV
jgi:hypothetical protein